MGIPSRQIGWSVEDNLLWYILKEVVQLQKTLSHEGGPVIAVNGQTGIVTLTPTDVGALALNGSNANTDINIGPYSFAATSIGANIISFSDSQLSSGAQYSYPTQESGLYNVDAGQKVASYDYNLTTYYYGNGVLTVESGVVKSNGNQVIDRSILLTGTWSATLAGETDTVITLPSTLPDANYIIALTPTSAAAVQYPSFINSRNTNGFKVAFTSPVTGTVDFEYIIYRT